MFTTYKRFIFLFVYSLLMPQTSFGSVATYQLTVTNNWTPDTHPNNYPSAGGHFSWLGGGTHNASQSFWEPGGYASSGFELMAEIGVTTAFVNEIAAEFGSPLEWRHWFCPPTTDHTHCGSLSVQFTIDNSQPLITLTSMLGPSPDWFVGVSDLSLLANGHWISSLDVPLALYDAGTEEGAIPKMDNQETAPFKPISLISYENGNYVSSTEEHIVGSFAFKLINVTEELPSNQWKQISLPVIPTQGANTVRAIFGDELPVNTYTSEWVLYAYDSENKVYVDPGLDGILSRGVGYWIIQVTDSTVTLSIDNYETADETDFELALNSINGTGWNLTGYPMMKTMPWNQVRIKTDAVETDCGKASGCTLTAAEQDNIFHNQAWVYDGEKYVALEGNAELQPWMGFWCATLPGANGINPKLIFPAQ